MMKPIPHLFHQGIKASKDNRRLANAPRFAVSLVLLLLLSSGLSAQTIIWSDSFEQGKRPTTDQCENWTAFLDQLEGRTFVSVTMSGSLDPIGKTLSDPAAVNELARLLKLRTPGAVGPEGNRWVVTTCFASGCGSSVGISYNGAESECSCNDTYSIRPHITNGDWGGINVSSGCGAVSQTMKLEFNTGVSISAKGPTTLCEDGQVILSTKADICTGTLTYLWSNGATTPSITVTEPGDYYVTVTGAGGCFGVSQTISVTRTDVAVNAGLDAAYCSEPVQLLASGASTTGTGAGVANEICIFNAPNEFGEEDECTFMTDVCFDGANVVGTSSYSTSVSFANPTQLRYHIFYSARATTLFTVRLNGVPLGSYRETLTPGRCDTRSLGQYPRSFIFDDTQFKKHWLAGENILQVDVVIESPLGGDILLSGIIAEVVDSKESYVWSPSTGLDDPTIRNPFASPTSPMEYMVTYTDANGCVATDVVKVNLNCDAPPVAKCQPVNVKVQGTCEAVVAASEFNAGSTSAPGTQMSFSVSPAGPYPVGETDVIFKVTDSNNRTSTCSTKVVVTNDAPVISSVTASPASVSVNQPVTLTTVFSDDNAKEATIDWGDLSTLEIINPIDPTFSTSHTYASAGNYSVTVTVTDNCGGSATYVYQSIVVSQKRTGSVDGGGWYDSPRGAYRKDLRATGKVNFAFEGEYKSGSDVLHGQITLNFHEPKMKFRSSELHSLAIDGETAVLIGSGSIDHKPGYGILIGMVDDDTKNKDKKDKDKKEPKKNDRIRVKIWDPSGKVIYDTQLGEPDEAIAEIKIGGGDIEINDSGSTFKDAIEDAVDSFFGSESASVYPNPFTDYLNVQFSAESREDVVIQLMDLTGKVVASQVSPVSGDGYYSLDVPAKAREGIYIVTIKQGKRIEVLRLVRK